ncbi:MAG: hypothetical protein EBT06_01895 [Gammaproteobacteria bacterium]|nr:hypothetical protein [Gammaproteobacteria bacterium]NBT43672.1 hypothetical protein [Gammaproteobacteria bacterium]NBY23780.1 hypothetical protein [Gammaproteobacteria bacterium]NDE33453.1 hypothetical protein [Gammaproteobacteria bacterium]NDE56349.1 hypothetical protein [Gammaproteobacteria bacterium]
MIFLSLKDLFMKEFNIIQATTLLMLTAMTDDNHLGKSFNQEAFRCPFTTASPFTLSLVLGLEREHAPNCRFADRVMP